jgi:MSHA biogenesis protein MshE
MQPRLKMRLGDLLVHENIITSEQLNQALSAQRSTGRKLGDTLIELNFISEPQLLRFLAQQLNVPFLDISHRNITPEHAQLLPETYARRYRALVLEVDDKTVLLGMSDPTDLGGLDQLMPLFEPRTVELAIVQDNQIVEAFDSVYRRTRDIASFAEKLHEEYEDDVEFELSALDDNTSDATVVKLLHSIFEDAVQVRASDIHIEPDENILRIRQRVDGVLQENTLDQVKIASALVLRLKLMSGLDISEKRIPQDGRFNIKVKGHTIDVRLSTMPVSNGESVVMRLLDQSAGLLTLDQTGMPDAMVRKFRAAIHRPHGMILVTGPTGSGKTTTLYGALSELNKPDLKIITVEDPIEYRLPRINQVQTNAKIGLDFASILRTTLRQDPDVIMVGEMRDQETVEIGLRGALTGHLVLSTLHTNDAVTSAIRLIDMGAAPYLVATSLRGIVAQRLVRRICENCKTTSAPSVQEQAWVRFLMPELENATFYKGTGCNTCNHTGYKGRIGVFEMLEMNEDMMESLRENNTQGFVDATKANKDFTPLSHMALDYAAEGKTSLDEVFKVAEFVPEVINH